MRTRKRLRAGLVVTVMAMAALAVACSDPPAPTPRPPSAERTPTVQVLPTVTPTPTGQALSPERPIPDPWESGVPVDGFAGDLFQWVPRDSIAAVFEPVIKTVEWADELMPTGRIPVPRMKEDELVIGVSINGDHRAYSVPYLGRHEVINDVVGGRKIAVTWCPLCYTAIVFDREVEGRELTFGVSGMLLMNSLVMYDRETDSLWSQFAAEAVSGPLDGARLEMVPSQLTPWVDWRRQYPDTLVIEKVGFPSSFDTYLGYYLRGSAGEIGEINEDERLRTKEFVLGIAGENAQKAYAVRDLRKLWVLNDAFEERDIVVLITNGGATTAVYSRDVGDRTLTFEQAESQFQMIDLETGSVWDKATGVAVSGDLEGERLVRRESFVAFWFAWTDYHPETEVYRPQAGP